MKRPFEHNIFIARERRTMFMLLIIVMIIFGIKFSLPFFVKQQEFDYSVFESEIEAYRNAHVPALASAEIEIAAFDINEVTSRELEQFGLPKPVAERWIKYREAIGGFGSVDQVQKIYGLDAGWYKQNSEKLQITKKIEETIIDDLPRELLTLFSFDPNTVTEEELEILGFSPRARKSLINYRKKGGTFYKTDELKYLYGVDEDFFDRILNYVEIDTAILPHIKKEIKKDSAVLKAEIPVLAASRPIVVDINNSNVFQWQMLKGIGASYAARIIKYRERLGGFASVQQVAETYNIPDSVFQGIKPYLTISPITKPIPINTISLDSLRLHPYINWKQASIIVNYRQQHGPYQAPEDLLKTRVFDTAFVKRIEPYLAF